MPNMSEQFYKYIATTIVEHLSSRQLEGGERFSLYMEETNAVSTLYNTIGNSGFEKIPFSYQHEKGTTSFETYAININDSHLIVVASNNDVREDFITTLRNQVAKQEGNFTKKNLLILFSGRLDSLLGGSEDLTKAGMPLNSKIFREKLINSIKTESGLKPYEKAILEYSLDKMKEDIATDNYSIFDYQGIVGTINQKTIKTDDYHTLGLFPHKELSSITTPKILKSNIRENNEYFEEIEHVFNHGDSSNDLDKLLSDRGIKELNSTNSDKNWKNNDFSDIAKWIEERSKVAPAEFTGKPPYECTLGENFVFGRADGTSTSKKRNTNVIIFNPMNIFPVSLSLKFNKRVKKDAIKVDKDECLHISTHGSRINIDVLEKDLNFWRLQYHDDASGKNFQFKILMFKCQPHLLEPIKKVFSIQKNKPHRVELNCGDEPLMFNKEADLEKKVTLEENGSYELNPNEQLSLKIKDDYELDVIPFNLKVEEDTIPFNLIPEKPKLQPIKGLKVWKDKRELGKSFNYEVSKVKDDKDVVKLTTVNEEFTVSGEFRKRLEWEQYIVNSHSMSWAIDVDGKIKETELHYVPSILSNAFSELRILYRENNTLPSLTPLKGEYLLKTKKLVNTFLECINGFTNKSTTTDTLNEIMQVGVICENYHHKDIHISPLHPLMLAYQIVLNESVEAEELYDAILIKLTPINLLPLIRWKDNNSIYSPTENSSIPEWVRYNNKKEFKKGISKSFVRKLVNDKINEFQHHFSYLFVNPQSPIVINAFNLGDCKEILQGLFDYYEKKLAKEKRIDNLPCIDVNIYGSGKWVTKFEELTFYQNAKELRDKEEELNLRLKTPYNYDSDDLLNTFRKKVHFYTKSIEDVSYAHISFYHFDQMKIEYSDLIMDDVPTGIALKGLFSDLTSEFSNQSYRTGFSTKGLGDSRSILENTAIAYNAMARVSFSPLLYEKEKSICSSISFNIKTSLEKIYEKSQWVTFIEPKVGLNFFKENEKVVIIHYSDQYNNTSGYDAITVTKKTKQYQYVLDEFLKSKHIPSKGKQANTSDIINLFNSINGDWLLKIISQNNPNYKNEKLSLLSAIKAALALYDHPDIVWIPTSLEEVLRVSGNAGLNQKEGLFSTKNLGKTGVFSDDLLLIGLEKIDGKLKMYLYPIEVKIGENKANVIKKAKEQGLKTAGLLQDIFKITDNEESLNVFKVGLYKNFFAKIALVTTEKLKLYNVWSDNDAKWDNVLFDFRNELLNNDFEVSELGNYIERYGVFLFGGSFRRKVVKEDGGMVFSFLKEDGYKFLSNGINHWIDTLVLQTNSIDKKLLLGTQYKPNDSNEKISQVIIKNEPSEEIISSPSLEKKEYLSAQVTNKPERPIEILFGHDINSRQEIKWHPSTTSKVLHTNTGIIGTMGTGKTQFTKSLVTQLLWESKNNVDGKPIGILIFDYKGDYIKGDFVKATNAKVYDLYHLPYNPLAIDIHENALNLLPLHIASTIKETISKAYGLGKKQEQLLKSVIMDAYEAKGINKAKRDTWTKPAPTISDVCELFMMDEKVTQDSLYAALDSLQDFEIFEPDTSKTQSLFDLLEGVLVINLSGYDESVQNLVVAITLDLFYSQMQKAGHSKIDGDFRQLNKMILVDEADNFLSKNFNSIRKILKEGREFGVGSVLSTQFLSHFSTSDNDYSTYILTWIVHRVNEIRTREVDSLFKLDSKDTTNQLMNEIKSLEKHHSVVNLAGSDPLFIKDKAFWELWKEIKT